MNFGTKIRTILRVVVSLQNTAVVLTASVQAFASEYHIGWLTFAWAIFALVCNFIVDTVTTYFNNDYTEIAAEATGEMRAKKAELKGEVIGECFHVDEEEEPEDE